MYCVTLEFINTCSCCDSLCRVLQDIAAKNKNISLTVYYAGKDFDYIPKYGMIAKGTLIVNGKSRYEESALSKKRIEEIVDAALRGEA